MRFLLVLVLLAVPWNLEAAAPPADRSAQGPRLARVVVTGLDKGGGRSSIMMGGRGKFITVDVTLRVLLLDGKKTLLVVIDHSRVRRPMEEIRSDRVYAISGRLAVEGPGVQTGLMRIRTEGMLTVKDDAVVLLADSVTLVDEKNKADFPAQGKVSVVGAAVCGKVDLGLLDRPTLAVRNGRAAIILEGDKARVASAGKGMLRATGTLSVDDRGLIRLQAEQLVSGSKPSAATLAEAAIEEAGGWVRRREGVNGAVVGASMAVPQMTDAHLAFLRAFPLLEELDLTGARLTDEGLKSLRYLKSLRTLSLAETGIADRGLAPLEGLTKLETLDLHGNTITDTGLSHLQRLTELKTLDLAKTQVTHRGLEALKGLARLELVTLDDAQMTDEMLGWLIREDRLHLLTRAQGAKGRPRTTADIVSLSLNNAPLTDAGLVHLGKLPNLQTLYLRGTPVTDAGLVHLSGSRKLQNIYLTRTKVKGPGLVHLKGLDRLELLALADDQLTDAMLAGLAQADKLHVLSRGRNKKGGRPASGAEITSFSLRDTPVTDAGLVHLEGLTNLETLTLGKTGVKGPGLEHLKDMSKLRMLYLPDSQVTDDVLAGLARADKLHILFGARDSRGNRATSRADITSLSLSGTAITDAGLAHLMGLAKLRTVSVSRTKVTAEGIAELQKAIPGVKVSR